MANLFSKWKYPRSYQPGRNRRADIIVFSFLLMMILITFGVSFVPGFEESVSSLLADLRATVAFIAMMVLLLLLGYVIAASSRRY